MNAKHRSDRIERDVIIQRTDYNRSKSKHSSDKSAVVLAVLISGFATRIQYNHDNDYHHDKWP